MSFLYNDNDDDDGYDDDDGDDDGYDDDDNDTYQGGRMT